MFSETGIAELEAFETRKKADNPKKKTVHRSFNTFGTLVSKFHYFQITQTAAVKNPIYSVFS
jgi:hypothetical protein